MMPPSRGDFPLRPCRSLASALSCRAHLVCSRTEVVDDSRESLIHVPPAKFRYYGGSPSENHATIGAFLFLPYMKTLSFNKTAVAPDLAQPNITIRSGTIEATPFPEWDIGTKSAPLLLLIETLTSR